jgi:hypothetical protein
MDTDRNAGAPPPYETRDANPGSLLKFGVVLVLTLAVTWGASKWVFDYFGRVQQLGPAATPFERGRPLPPLPQLQVTPVEDLAQFRAGQEKDLDSYGWVDRSRGTVHIPIQRAMDLLLERGIPARPGAGAAGAAGAQRGAN